MSESDDDMNVNNMDQEDLLFGPWGQQRVFHVGSTCPGLRLRGNGLYECKAGQLASFMVRLAPVLLNMPITFVLRHQTTDEVVQINFMTIYNFGYRCLYILKDQGMYNLIIKLGQVELPPIRVQCIDNENYLEDLEESTHILLASLQGSSEVVKDLQNKCALYQRQAKAFLEKLQEVTDLWVAAFDSTKTASEAAVDALNQAMELVTDEAEEENEFTDSETEEDDVFLGSDHQEDDDDNDEEDNDDNRRNRIADRQGSPFLVFLRNEQAQQLPDEEVEEDHPLGDVEPEEDEPFRESSVKRRLEYSDESLADDSDRGSKRRRSESNEGTLSIPPEEDEDNDHPVNVHQMSPTPSPQSSRSGASSRRSSRSVSSRSHRSRDSQTPPQSPSLSPPPPSPVAPRPSRRRCGEMELRDASPISYRRFFLLRGGQ